MQTDKIVFAKARDIGEKFNATFAFIGQNFKDMFTALIYLAGPFALVGGIASGIWQVRNINLMAGVASGKRVVSPFDVFSTEYFIVMLCSIAGAVAASLTIVGYIRQYNQNSIGEKVTWQQILESSKKDFIPVFLYGIGFMLIIMIGFLVFMIPGIYLSIGLSLMIYVRVFEGEGFFKCISRSLHLTSGNWWGTFGLLLVCFFLQIVFILLLFFANTSLTAFVQLNLSSSANSSLMEAYMIIYSVLSHFISWIFYVITLVALCFQYFNLVEKKDSTGLLSRIDSIGKTPEAIAGNEESY